MVDLGPSFRALDELPVPDALERFDTLQPRPGDQEPKHGGRRLAVAASALAIALAGFLLARHVYASIERHPVDQPSPQPGIATGAIPPHGSITFDAMAPGNQPWSELAFIGPDGIVPMTDARSQRLVAGDAAWSPDGSRVAFVLGRTDSWRFTGDGTLVVMNADGSGLQRLTHGMGVTSPTWSPDGTRLAFVRNQGTSLCTIRADGSDLRVIASERGYYQVPRWSPTGDLILFQSRVDGSEFGRTFVIHPDGTGEQLLPLPLAEGSFPSWSPNGRRLAYSDGARIAIFDLGTGRTVATLPRCAGCYGDMFPAWSPDGRRIAFVREDRRTHWSLFLFDLTTDTLSHLGPPATEQFSPAWRP